MKHSVMLTIASLMSIVLMTFHLSGDIIRGMEKGGTSNLTALPILGCMAVRNAGARRTAIRVRHHAPRVSSWIGHSHHPHDGSRCWCPDRQDPERSLPLRLDNHRARGDHAFLCHPLSARTVEPAMGPVPVVQLFELHREPELFKIRTQAEKYLQSREDKWQSSTSMSHNARPLK